MNFMIFDSTGNAIDAFDDGDQARIALREMIIADPSAATELALFAFDESGSVVGEAEIAADVVPELVRRMTLRGAFSFVQLNYVTFTSIWRTEGAVEQSRSLNGVAASGEAVA